MRDVFPQNMIATFTVFPAPAISNIVIEPYNAILASHHLIENANQVYCFDNEVLHSIQQNRMGNKDCTVQDLNKLINHSMNDISSSNRYGGQLNSNLRKIGINIIAYERLHFLATSFAPLSINENFEYRSLSISDLVQQMFFPSNIHCSIDTKKGMYMAAMCIFRGEDLSTKLINEKLTAIQEKNSTNYLAWVPNNICNSVVDAPHLGYPKSATLIANNTGIAYIWENMSEKFNVMFSKNAFIHWYTAVDGMEDMEFAESDSNCSDLVAEYHTREKVDADTDME